MFKDNIPLAELVLRIIVGKPDLILTKCETQADLKRVTGARSICLDAYATDSTGKKYDIEIQRSDNGADPHRARYHSSVMDVENLDKDQEYRELPDSYVVFITEKDYYKAGKPVYVIQNINLTLGLPFEDADIGKLMHDFNCTSAEEMNFDLMAERTRYLKENPKGVGSMCKAMEELRVESRKEMAVEMAQSLYEQGVSIEQIAKASKVDVDTVKGWLTPKAG